MNEDITPALAAAIKPLYRNPAAETRWVEGAVQTLERTRPHDFERLRRRIGLVAGLAHLARLVDTQRAGALVGVFFETILDSGEASLAKPSQKWLHYLLQNDDWLTPAFQIARLIHFSEPAEAPAEAVAGVAATYDAKAFDGGLKPLQALRAIRAEAATDAERRIIDLLWSEEGQALCDRHFRLQDYHYQNTAKQIAASFQLLKSQRVRPHSVLDESPVGLAWSTLRATAGRPPQPASAPSTNHAQSDNFERRKAALRSTEELVAPIPETTQDRAPADEEHREQLDAATDLSHDVAGEDAAPDQSERTMDPDLRLLMNVRRSRPPAPTDGHPQEEDMPDSITTADTPKADAAATIARLRAHLKQINTLTVEAQELLRALEPDLAHVAGVMAELDQMVSRWKAERNAA